MELEVRGMISGESKSISLEPEATFADLRSRVAEAFKLESPEQCILALESSPEVPLTPAGLTPVADLGVTSASIILMRTLAEAWFWTDDTAEQLLSRQPVESTFGQAMEALLGNRCGEPGEAMLPAQYGVVRVLGSSFPGTAEEVLAFLRGSSGAHKPVVPGFVLDGVEVLPSEWPVAPWNDFEALSEEKAEDLLSFSSMYEMGPNEQTRKASKAALPAMMCASPGASQEEVDAMTKNCRFYGIFSEDAEINDERRPFAILKDDRTFFLKERPTLNPDWTDGGFLSDWSVALVVCANPEKRTLAFAYSAMYFGQ